MMAMHGEDEEFPPPMPIWQQPWKGQDVEPTQFVFDCCSPTSPAASPADQTLAPPTPPKREGGSDTESEKTCTPTPPKREIGSDTECPTIIDPKNVMEPTEQIMEKISSPKDEKITSPKDGDTTSPKMEIDHSDIKTADLEDVKVEAEMKDEFEPGASQHVGVADLQEMKVELEDINDELLGMAAGEVNTENVEAVASSSEDPDAVAAAKHRKFKAAKNRREKKRQKRRRIEGKEALRQQRLAETMQNAAQ